VVATAAYERWGVGPGSSSEPSKPCRPPFETHSISVFPAVNRFCQKLEHNLEILVIRLC
jgi:hypothetical protein